MQGYPQAGRVKEENEFQRPLQRCVCMRERKRKKKELYKRLRGWGEPIDFRLLKNPSESLSQL